jgi:glycosidase
MVFLSMKKSILLNQEAKKRYNLPADPILEVTGRISLHQIVNKINQEKIKQGEQVFKASELNIIMLLNTIFQKVMDSYQTQNLFQKFYREVKKELPAQELASLFQKYKDSFGLKQKSPTELIPEMLKTWLHNSNPAAHNYRELYSDISLRYSIYEEFLNQIQIFFAEQKTLTTGKSLIELLQEPFLKYPDSLQKQLSYIRDNWGHWLGDDMVELLSALDFVKEETKPRFLGPAAATVYNFDDEDDYERFSEDSSWMTKLVMIAKSTYVWLDQLSQKYNRDITRLDDIPEEELKSLSEQGFTGLWLIGIWQRSAASQKIKHLTGNEDAIASAYSLYDYQIAEDLGGEAAIEELSHKAWKYGIRLGCDMVPNHVGIDSKWIYQHPEWFIQTERSPFPNYIFSSLNLSSHPDFEIYLEEHYFDRTDAAVVFKMHDHVNHKIRYIYHGNDGTSFPWNDTAQLNYLLPQVRSAVIEEIKKIARRFPIIRFDAAMTLTKKHFQRLWYPQPGTGGDIPSRSQFAMTKKEFNRHMPIEFWQQVVDEINKELPDTLLLAEAFWMMESYFVRNLGMHRVYNSAFMNMLKDEENEKYRQSIINVLKFNPQILKRFVNFMSNPDEETAIAQFGSDDKYFGICVMMSTLPGLPMFAHGQIEGYKERYGMEFVRAKWQEQINDKLVQRHWQEIFPILKKRYLFANVENFRLLNFETEPNNTYKDVFAYSNSNDNEIALVLYHNRYAEVFGRVYSGYDHQNKTEVKLGDILQIPNHADSFVIFYDLAHRLEYIYNCAEIHQKGLPVHLQAYKFRVFLKSRIVSYSALYRQAWQQLQGKGTENIDQFVATIKLQPLLKSFAKLLTKEDVHKLIDSEDYIETSNYLKKDFNPRLQQFLQELQKQIDKKISITERIYSINKELLFAVQTSSYVKCKDISWLQLSPMLWQILKKIEAHSEQDYLIFYWIILQNLETDQIDALSILEEKRLKTIILNKLGNINSESALERLKIALTTENVWQQLESQTYFTVVRSLFNNDIIRKYLEINEYENTLWFRQEKFEYFFLTLFSVNWFNLSFRELKQQYKTFEKFMVNLWEAKQQSQFKVEELLNYFKKG